MLTSQLASQCVETFKFAIDYYCLQIKSISCSENENQKPLWVFHLIKRNESSSIYFNVGTFQHMVTHQDASER